MAGSPNVVELLLRVKEQGTEAIVRAKAALAQLGETAKAAASGLSATAKAQDGATQAAAKADTANRKLAQGMASISTTLDRLQKAYALWIAAQATLGAVRELTNLADVYSGINARLKLATVSERECADALLQFG